MVHPLVVKEKNNVNEIQMYMCQNIITAKATKLHLYLMSEKLASLSGLSAAGRQVVQRSNWILDWPITLSPTELGIRSGYQA